MAKRKAVKRRSEAANSKNGKGTRKRVKKKSSKRVVDTTRLGNGQQAIHQMKDEFEVSPAVKKSAERYKQALLTKAEALTSVNLRRAQLMDAMDEDGIDVVAVELDGVKHEFWLDTERKVKQRKKKKKQDA